uniref:Uncharacterized protein n=1 Tax=Arundo donax TaxID=35708 RepID=A0A0A9BSE2_ARUDO
MTTMSGYKTV